MRIWTVPFPNYHLEPRNEEWHREGWTKWNLVKAATPRFPGHQQPKVPLWGYEDEADPRVSEQQIAAAADRGITAFIYDTPNSGRQHAGGGS